MAQIAHARTFNGTSDEIGLSIGGLAGAWGATTIAAIVKPASAAGSNGTIFGIQDTMNLAVDRSVPNQDLFDYGTFQSWGSFGIDLDEWVLMAWTKATGTAAPTVHRYRYQEQDWVHSPFASQPNFPSAAGTTRIGTNQFSQFFPGLVALIGIWKTVALTDVNMEGLTRFLSAWQALSPTSLLLLNQASTSMDVRDLAGTSHQSSISGTTATAVSDLPFDVGNASGYRRIYGPAQLGTSAADLYINPTGFRTEIVGIQVNNPSGAEIEVTLSVGTDAASTRILDQQPVAAGASFNGRRMTNHTLEGGEKIQGFCDVGSTAVVMIDAYVQTL